jgi:hypothetical protein
MRSTWFSRSLLVVPIALLLAVLLAPVAPAAAATWGSVTIHSRICPTSPPPPTSLFADCHHRPGPDGAAFRLDSRQAKGINSSGNVKFGQVRPGDHRVRLTSDFQPNEFLRMRVYCADIKSGEDAVEVAVRSGNQVSFPVSVTSGARVVCDVYFIPISGR